MSSVVVGLVRAESPDDELVTYEWATETRFTGSVHVAPTTVSLAIDDGGELWERTLTRTRDLYGDLTRCLAALDELRTAAASAEVADLREPPEAVLAPEIRRDASAG